MKIHPERIYFHTKTAPYAQLIKNIVNTKQGAGYYSINLNLNDLSSGVYFYQLISDGEIIGTKKFVVLK